MYHITYHDVKDVIEQTVVICSVLHTFLPPWDFLVDFPRVQKVYKVVIYVIGYVAISGRSAVYRKLSIENSEGVNNYKAVKEIQQDKFVEKELKKQ